MSYLFQFPRYNPKTPFWLPIVLNLGILESERDKNPELLFWKRNGRIYGGRAWFQGRIFFRSQYIGQKGHFDICKVWFQGLISFLFQDNGHFGCPLGSILAFCDINEIKTTNHFYGSGMAEFMGVEHGSRVVSLLISRIMAILAAR